MIDRLLLIAMLGGSVANAQVPVAQPALRGLPVQAPSPTLILPRDTPVELMAPAEISTASAYPGQIFRLRVHRAVMIDGRMIVPVGTAAFGTVVEARDSGGLGKNGRMTARLLHIQLGDVQIPIEGEISAKGTGAGSAGVAILFTGVAGLFHRGNNAKIKAGEMVAGFVGQDMIFDMSGSMPRPVSGNAVLPAPPSAAIAIPVSAAR